MSASSPWTPFHAQVHRTLRARRLLSQGQRVLVAVSGGQDSLCLLKLLLDLQPKWHWELAIAHCDHRWSGDVGNAEFVQHIAQVWQMPFYLQTAEQITTSEAGAREWRYQALVKIAQQQNYTHIATGHTASDRAETLLYNLIRGSGADGLQALTWQRGLAPGIVLVRPLLTMSRRETAEFCQAMHLTFWQDPANQDLSHARNRIRQELIPYLQTHLNPRAEYSLAQTAELLQADVEYLEAEATKLLAAVLDSDQAALNRRILHQAPLALQRRALRQFLQSVLVCDPSFDQVEKLIFLTTAPNRSQSDPFPGGAIAQVSGEWISLIQQPTNKR